MNLLASLVLLFATLLPSFAQASILCGQPFEKIVYVAYGPTATKSAANSGRDYSSPKGFYDGDLFSIPKNVIVENTYVIVDESVVGPTAFNLGDDDSATGFVASSSPSFTEGNMYFWDITYKGAYLKSGTSLLAKYYGATGKEMKLDVTGTASAGKLRVITKGSTACQ